MKIKYLIYFLYGLNLSLWGSVGIYAQSNKMKSISWYEMEEAVKLNEKKPRKFLIYVYSDNCSWCRKMENETFSSRAVADYINQNFHAVKINSNIKRDINYNNRKFSYIPAEPNTGSPAHHEFLVVLLQGRMAYPTVVCLDENMVYIDVERGFKSVAPFRNFLSYIVENVYQKGKSFDEYFSNQ